MQLDSFLKSKIRWHLGYNQTSIPAGDLARLEEAVDNIQDSFWYSKITEQIKTEERLTEQLKAEGVKPSKPTKKETFPVDVRLNINTASARQIADALPGVGLKTARDIKDLQSTMLGDKFIKLEQLKSIKRVDWDELIKENLIRVE